MLFELKTRVRRPLPALATVALISMMSSASAQQILLEPDQPARLLFVAPNLAHAAESLEAPADQLLRWVALHEITHALQFGGVPWLRPHLSGLVEELTGALQSMKETLARVPAR